MSNSMDSFLNKVTSQIKSKKAKKAVQAELEYHLKSSKKSWMEKGFNELEAEKKAVEEMGNPIKLGNDLNKVHTPKFISYLKPFLVHIIIGILTGIIFNIIGSFDQLMINDLLRNIFYAIETVFVIYLYLFLGRKFLGFSSRKSLLKSLGSILAVNLFLGLSGYLMINLGSNVMAENGQFPIIILMFFNYSFYSIISSLSTMPEAISLLLLCSLSPLLLYIGSRSGKKFMDN